MLDTNTIDSKTWNLGQNSDLTDIDDSSTVKEWSVDVDYETNFFDESFGLEISILHNGEPYQNLYENINPVNSTNLIQLLELTDFENGEKRTFSQVIRHNGTDSSHALFNFGK